MKAIAKVTDNVVKKGEVFNVIEEDNYTFQRVIIKISNDRIHGFWGNKEDFEIIE
jgi:hypothetical protein